MIDLVKIWGIFATMFLVLGIYQWKMRGKSIAHFKLSERPMRQQGIEASIKILGSDIDKPLKDFVDNFNDHIDNLNQTSSKQHKAQAIGYWVASATAIFSLNLAIGG